jgi:hypothetical protein
MATKALGSLSAAQMKAWREALVSGEFKQGSGALKENVADYNEPAEYQYCCLGVVQKLCKLRAAFGGEGDSYLSRSAIPRPIQELLAGLNDGADGFHCKFKAFTFKQIAAVLTVPEELLSEFAARYKAVFAASDTNVSQKAMNTLLKDIKAAAKAHAE